MLSKSLSKIFLLSYLVCITFSASVVLIMHYINSDYNPMNRYISEYANGNFGKLAAFSFSVFGLSIVMFYLWIRKIIPKKLKSKIGLNLILLFGLSMIIIGFFNTDPKMGQITTNGIIHGLAAVVGLFSFSIGSLLISKKLKRNILQTLSWFSLFLIPFLLLGSFVDSNFVTLDFLKIFSDTVGLVERLYFLAVILWIILATYYTNKNT